MQTSNPIQALAVRAHATVLLRTNDLRQAMICRLDSRDERGDVAARTVGIAIMAALAITVGGIIATKVTGKANAINLDSGP